MSNCEHCGKPVESPLPVHKVCALVWLIREHEINPPSGDFGMLVAVEDLRQAQAIVASEAREREIR